ncbi:MAG: response regulator [bacterium]
MKKELRILIADRNRHVRDYLKRELSREHHEVLLADGVDEIMRLVQQQQPFNLIILDPDLLDMDNPSLLKRILGRMKQTPVIMHTYQSNITDEPFEDFQVSLIEKKGNSIENIKNFITNIQLDREPFTVRKKGLFESIEQVEEGKSDDVKKPWLTR